MKRLLHHAYQLLPALVSLGLLAWVLRSADLSRALGLVRALGLWLPLLLVPNLIAVLAEAAGWWLSFDRLGGRPRFRSLASVRVIGDALIPLREREEDIPILIEHFLNKFNGENSRSVVMDKSALQVFLNYHWPGNVRELENTIERLVVMSGTDIITSTDLPIYEYLPPEIFRPGSIFNNEYRGT